MSSCTPRLGFWSIRNDKYIHCYYTLWCFNLCTGVSYKTLLDIDKKGLFSRKRQRVISFIPAVWTGKTLGSKMWLRNKIMWRINSVKCLLHSMTCYCTANSTSFCVITVNKQESAYDHIGRIGQRRRWPFYSLTTDQAGESIENLELMENNRPERTKRWRELALVKNVMVKLMQKCFKQAETVNINEWGRGRCNNMWRNVRLTTFLIGLGKKIWKWYFKMVRIWIVFVFQ